MKKLIFSIMISVFACVAVLAQEQKAVPFNGVVADILGQPLKGAKVWVVDPNYYTTTDKKGKFGLTNVQPTDTLHVKYKKQLYLIPVDTMKSVRVRLGDELKYEVRQDEELVNTGFGFVKRRESCNSSTGISGEVLVRTGRIDLMEALQGLVPGLTIINGKAVIRGLATIYGSSDPIYIVDGVEVESLSYVNVYSVDRVEVLKDANLYGAKGANGAILVTTKRGGSKM